MEMHVEAQWNKYAPSKQHNYSTKQNSRTFTIQIQIKNIWETMKFFQAAASQSPADEGNSSAAHQEMGRGVQGYVE